MLKLKRVEIHGFKSFFDKTEMRFHGAGIAAVVGPNGCGKSNLSDAMSWVLGEQSAKSLRGARMEDVIFAGTRERKPLGMASVTMTLLDVHGSSPLPGVTADGEAPVETNGNGHLPHVPANGHGPKEVTVTRRLFRDGESEYLINGRAARLRDIQDLFLGTGLGPESYAIIEQGRIGQILSNRPQDRRAVVEEAAGITRFKTKKRLSEAKLEGAKQNLNRVFDILEEVGRQVNSLKRQASKAKRYDELKTEMVHHLRRALTGKFRVLEREAAKTALDLNQAQALLHSLNGQVAEKERDNASLRSQCYAIEKELTEARARLAELRIEDERTRGRLDHQAKQVGTIDARLAQDETETAQVEERLDRQRTELAAFLESVAASNATPNPAATAWQPKAPSATVFCNRFRSAGASSKPAANKCCVCSAKRPISGINSPSWTNIWSPSTGTRSAPARRKPAPPPKWTALTSAKPSFLHRSPPGNWS